MDSQDILAGQSYKAYEYFGVKLNGGGEFKLFAPNALKVRLILNGKALDMKQDEYGVWSIFVSECKTGYFYHYEITSKKFEIVNRCDPFGYSFALKPYMENIVCDIDDYCWTDFEWMSNRNKCINKPVNIYEIHFGSWKIKDNSQGDERYYTYKQLSQKLIPYLIEMGYTHVELMPITEYPSDESWGYQALGFYAPTSRYGQPKDLMEFIDDCHKNSIGVILDFPAVHFACDKFGLHMFDSTAVYESDDPSRRYTQWGTVFFDFKKPYVLSFVKSAINFWIEKYHFDAIRYDAAAYLIYLNGQKENPINHEGIWFLKNTNYLLAGIHPDVMLIAEDSTDCDKVTLPVENGGLGFDYKWNMGFMNDTLKYIQLPFNERNKNSRLMTFSMSYFYQNKFMLAYSHDENVHGKKTMLDKCFGTHSQKIAQIKLLYAFQFAHPGKKLNFMGNELGEYLEWRYDKQLGWNILEYPDHRSLFEFLKNLHHVYLSHPALYKNDYSSLSFKWLDYGKERPIFAFKRMCEQQTIYAVFNFGDKDEEYQLNVEKNKIYKKLIYSAIDDKQNNNSLAAQNLVLNVKMPAFSCIYLT